MFLLIFGICLLTLATVVNGDTPANCTFDDVRGTWLFYETERSGNTNDDCHVMGPVIYKKRVTLYFPNVAVDSFGNQGSWTMVYNQGFEVRITGRSYFVFSYYEKEADTVTSYCDRTFNGWSRDVTVRNWSCFKGRKVEKVRPKIRHAKTSTHEGLVFFKHDEKLIDNINEKQKSWKAAKYNEYEDLTLHDHHRRAGGKMSKVLSNPRSKKATLVDKLMNAFLPERWDWRNVSGMNYLSPVRNQLKCGSCYAFASMAALESRIRVMTNNTETPVFSPQDVVSCSHLSQGCEGGFPYVIAGRYAQDRGVVIEGCNPYTGKDSECHTQKCRKHYTAYYKYVGGYFGACNEEIMKLALVKGGPLPVGMEVYDDFLHYKSGIYHHTGLTHRFNPLELTNHAVLLVGYDTSKSTGEKHWIVKNSWGEKWGEDGYFRIRRGNDEVAIESMAVEIIPIP